MDFIKQYDDFTEIKDEIAKFTGLLMFQKRLPNINELSAITKNIIFMKNIINHTGNTHYKNCLIFDILSAMHSITNKSIRQFHYIFRSFIENYVRSMLNLSDDDETGVNQLFRMMEEQFGDTEKNREIIEFISGEYGKSCLHVHSNSKANSTIQLYYMDIISNDDFTRRTLSSIINKILLILKKMTELLIYVYPNIVENSFYRRKQQLRFLIGDNLYSVFLSKIDK